MLCRHSFIFFLLVLAFHQKCFSQFSFAIDTVFFKNEVVPKVSVAPDSNVWVILYTDSSGVGNIDKFYNQTDFSSAFQSITASRFTDILGMDSTIALTATLNDYIIKFKAGAFTKLDENYGLQTPSVNSLLRVQNSLSYLLKEGVLAGTEKGLYTIINNTEVKRYVRYFQDSINTKTVVVYYHPYFLVYDERMDYQRYPGKYVEWKNHAITNTTDFYNYYSYFPSLPGDETQNSAIFLNNEIAATPVVLGQIYWGTSKGLKKASWNKIEFNPTIVLENRNVFKLFELRYFPYEVFKNSPMQQYYMFVGTDSGLYYLKPNYNSLPDNILSVPGTSHLKIYDIDADFCNEALWLATDKGLVRLLLNYVSDNSSVTSLDQFIEPKGTSYICENEGVLLYSIPGSGFTYQWQKDGVNIPGANTASYRSYTPGEYRVILSKKHCSYGFVDTTISVTVKLDSTVNLSFSYPDTIHTCENLPIRLETQNYPDYTFQWYQNNSEIPQKTSFWLEADVSGTYKIEVRNCNEISKSDSVYVYVHEVPEPILAIGSVPPFCEGDTVIIKVSPHFSKLIWYFNTMEMGSFLNKDSIYTTDSGIYRALFIDSNNCLKYSLPFELSISTNPIISITADKEPFCIGDTVVLTANTSESNIHWNTGKITPTILISGSDDFTVTATNSTGCKGYDSLKAEFFPRPEISLGNDTSLCEGDFIPIILSVNSGYAKYIWNGVESASSSYNANHQGLYTVTVYSQKGCQFVDSVIIRNTCDPIFIPNLVTVNQDNLNETFYIKNLVPNCELTIYTQWGDLIYQSSNYKNEWTFENHPTGVYFYHLKSAYFQKEWNGWVHLIR